VDGEPADQVDGVLCGAVFRGLAFERHRELGDRAAFPPQQQFGAAFGRAAVHGDGDFLEQGAQQLLAVLVGGGRGVPHLAQVVAEGQDRGALRGGEGGGACLLAVRQLSFGVGLGLQGALPFGFQPARHQPVLGIDGPVPAFGSGGLVAGLLDLAARLPPPRCRPAWPPPGSWRPATTP
jgi:hypothetical protein